MCIRDSTSTVLYCYGALFLQHIFLVPTQTLIHFKSALCSMNILFMEALSIYAEREREREVEYTASSHINLLCENTRRYIKS